jgi:RNA polymerase sigma factor (sigma-70 family)
MDKQFDDLSTYINLAKKTISKFSSKYHSSLRNEMLKNEDAISDVASAIMYADWRWDSNRVGKASGMVKSKYAYRNQCAIWAIQTYITKKYKTKHKKLSLDAVMGDSDLSHASIIESKTEQDPLEGIIENEKTDLIHSHIQELINSDIINDKQRQQLKMYYFDDMTLNEIGKKFNVTREAVRQNIKKAITLFQEIA